MNQLITKEIENLIEVGEKLTMDASTAQSQLSHKRTQELLSITARGGQLITRLYGADSHYFQMFQSAIQIPAFNSVHSNHYRHISVVVGIIVYILIPKKVKVISKGKEEKKESTFIN